MDANRFTKKSLEAMQNANQTAISHGNAQVEQIHLLHALISQEDGLIGQLTEKLGLNNRQAVAACESAISRLPKIAGRSGKVPECSVAAPSMQYSRQHSNDFAHFHT